MKRGLIGHTGFVGGNLSRQATFTDFFNSKNVESLAGQEFDQLVCAGAPAVKWLANKEPEADAESLRRLTRALDSTMARELILISTVDVYPRPVDVDEDSAIDPAQQQPYGRHRLQLEEFVLERFSKVFVLRLPALFGPGLKKNALYDFLHRNRVEAIDSESSFQWYDLANLWSDIERVRALDVRRINIATEPLLTGTIAKVAFGEAFENRLSAAPPRYDYHSKYASHWGQERYQYTANAVLSSIKSFVELERGRLAG